MRIAVIGAGIVGLATAHALADEGHEVTIIDREGPASGTSRGNAGWLAHTDIDPIASPKMLRQVPKFLLDPLGPLTIRKEYLLPILPWLTRLILASRPSQLDQSIAALTASQIGAFTTDQVRALTTDQLPALSTDTTLMSCRLMKSVPISASVMPRARSHTGQ